jgi:NTP pyrophosphatase (non-canonical NTP hydrolase)
MELGDVFSYLFQLAHMLDIDLDVMWELHKNKMVTKIYNKKSIPNTRTDEQAYDFRPEQHQ